MDTIYKKIKNDEECSMKKKLIVTCLALYVFVSSPMEQAPYDKILVSFWHQIKCKGFGKEHVNGCDKLRAPANLPYWNYLLGKMDHTSENEARSFFERYSETDDFVPVCTKVYTRMIRPHVCLLDAWDTESPHYIKNNYVLSFNLLEMYGDMKKIIKPLYESNNYNIERVTDENMLKQWVERIALEPGFEQDSEKVLSVYKRFALEMTSRNILLLAFDTNKNAIGAISVHINADKSLAGIFSLATKKGFESIKPWLVWKCIKKIKDTIAHDNFGIVYLGLKDEYKDIFNAMEFIISREVDLYKFAPKNEKKEIIEEKK